MICLPSAAVVSSPPIEYGFGPTNGRNAGESIVPMCLMSLLRNNVLITKSTANCPTFPTETDGCGKSVKNSVDFVR